jgi:prepilin-type processing-associated H-X9-DG protein
LLAPYIKNDRIWACPSGGGPFNDGSGTVRVIPPPYPPNDGGGVWSATISEIGYTVNGGMGGEAWLGPGYRMPISISLVRHPSDCFLLADGIKRAYQCPWGRMPDSGIHQIAYAGECGWQICCDEGGVAVCSANTPAEYARHSGGSNVAFVDGHVKWMNAGAIEDASSQDGCPNAFWGEFR